MSADKRTEFKIRQHGVREGLQMVEVWVGARFVGALYPGTQPNELRFISKHVVGATLDQADYPPVVEIRLELN